MPHAIYFLISGASVDCENWCTHRLGAQLAPRPRAAQVTRAAAPSQPRRNGDARAWEIRARALATRGSSARPISGRAESRHRSGEARLGCLHGMCWIWRNRAISDGRAPPRPFFPPSRLMRDRRRKRKTSRPARAGAFVIRESTAELMSAPTSQGLAPRARVNLGLVGRGMPSALCSFFANRPFNRTRN